MSVEKFRNWGSWNHPSRAKLIPPVIGAIGVVCTHTIMLFILNISQSGLIGLSIYALAAVVGYGTFWFFTISMLAQID